MRALVAALIILASPAARADRIIPAVARVTGRNGAFFQTDVRLLNTSLADTVTVVATFRPMSGASLSSSELRIPPRQQLAFDDVLRSLFGVSTETSGSLRVLAPDTVEVTSRTYNVKDPCTSGTFGTSVPERDLREAVGERRGERGASAFSGATARVWGTRCRCASKPRRPFKPTRSCWSAPRERPRATHSSLSCRTCRCARSRR